MIDLSKRTIKKELIDLGPKYYTAQEYADCLHQLSRVGLLLGGHRASLSAFSQLKTEPSSILDVGCGGGAFTKRLAQKYPLAKVVGIDYSKEAIDYAKKHHLCNNLSFEATDELELKAPHKSFDIVTCTLVCHHMTDTEIITFLQRAREIARYSIIINDLHRHVIALKSFSTIAPILFRNRLITHDGALSICRAFKKQEWLNYLLKAGFSKEQWTITWKWAFRWIINIKTSSSLAEE